MRRLVRRWVAEGSPGDPELLTWRQQQRLERSLAMRRQQEIFDKSMREADRQQACRQQSTVRTEVKEGEEPKVVTTVRDAPLNVQLLKTAQRAAEELERLSQREPLPEEPAKMPSEIELHEQVTYALRELRRQAEEAGRVTPGAASNITLISHVLDALLGEATYGLSHDPAAREIAERLLTGAAPIRPATLARCASEGTAGSCADCPAAAEQPERNPDKPPADENRAGAAPTAPAAVAVTSPLETSSSNTAIPAAEAANSQAGETAEKKPESIAVTRGGLSGDDSPRRCFSHTRHDRHLERRHDRRMLHERQAAAAAAAYVRGGPSATNGPSGGDGDDSVAVAHARSAGSMLAALPAEPVESAVV